MQFINYSAKKLVVTNFCISIGLALIIPIFLDLIEINYRIIFISFLGNFLVIILITVLIVDFFLLVAKKLNYQLLSTLNMILTLILFILLMYSFLNNIFEIVYVMNYSNSVLPLIYKIVFIWAGEHGSIMTWMLFNSIIIYFYRINNQNKDDLVFIRSVLVSLIISIVFLIILFSLNPFEVDSPPAFINGNPNLDPSLDPILMSPFMIWHPFFTFIAYAIFLIPFTITIAEIVTQDSKLLNSYQQNFYDFSLKIGWLVLTLSIGLGAYWAKIALNWGRYWGWDPVETVSLVPWFFITSFFHTRIFKKKNPTLIKLNVGLIFASIVFSTLITRGGGLNSLHAFTSGVELVIWVVVLGLLLIILSLYVIYVVLDYLMEEYRNKKLFFDYLSYLFLYGLAFVCIFGLLIPPFTHFLSEFLPINIIFIGTDYFIMTTLVLAVGLASSLIFCSLWEYHDIKWIGILIIIGIFIQSIFSFIILLLSSIWINPIVIVFIISLIASLFKLGKNPKFKKGFKYFFRLNSKTIIHAGISCILMGFLVTSYFQDFVFITGFTLLLIGIIPSILIAFFPRREITKNN